MTDPSKVVVQIGQRQPRKGGGRGGSGGGHVAPDEWSNDITRTTTGKPESTTHNTMLIMSHDPALAGLFALDEFANVVRMTRDMPWPGGERDQFTDADGTELSAWLGSPTRFQLSVKSDLVMDCVEAQARRNKYHPVREYLESLQWDGVQRVRSMFSELFSAPDNPYTRHVAHCFLVSAVARILFVDRKVRHNGAKVDFMVVLEGEQGRGKTSAVGELFGAEWYAEAMESPGGKDFYQDLRGRWGVEIGEMEAFSKADVTKVKQAITSRFDTYRPSYGRVSRSFRRECVFVGTTNEHEYLRDASGGRRFLPILVGQVDVTKIAVQRDQLWAEAVTLWRDGYRYWELPDEAVEEQEDRFSEDSWQGLIQRWLAGKSDETSYPPRMAPAGIGTPVPWTTTAELLGWALRIDVGKHGKPEQMRVAAIMRRLKWTHKRVRVKDAETERVRRWVPPGWVDEESNSVPF